jgi:predicted transcriptional regulator
MGDVSSGSPQERHVHETVGLTGLQLSILQVLWERGEATTQEVWERVVEQRPLALTTVATLLARLERKRVLAHRRRGRQNVYRATVTRAEVRRSKVRELTENLFDGDAAALMSHLVRADRVDADELERMRVLIEEAGSRDRGDADA